MYVEIKHGNTHSSRSLVKDCAMKFDACTYAKITTVQSYTGYISLVCCLGIDTHDAHL